jgi:hypothetical protein
MNNGGYKLSDETKEKMRLKKIGRISNAKGKKWSIASRLKLSLSKKGKPSSMKGKHFSKEFCEKMRVCHLGLKHSPGTIKKMSLVKLKEGSYQYKKDRTKLKKSDKKHLDCEYRDFMFGVKNRDNWKCKINNKECKGRLEAHHILNWIDYPDLRYDINNGITLCQFHHPRGRIKEKLMISEFQNLLLVSKE